MVPEPLAKSRLSMPLGSEVKSSVLSAPGSPTRLQQQAEEEGLNTPRTEDPVGALQPSQESRGAGEGSWAGSTAR